MIALEHYNEGLKPLKDFVRFKSLIKQLICDLNTQKLRLRYTCEKLLIDLALSDGELACLLDNPKSSGWQAEPLVLQLKERLHDSYTTYLELLDRLANTLHNLADKIGLDRQGRPQWVDAKTHKRYWKRFTTCLGRKEHDALLLQMSKDNDNLQHLATDNLQLGPRRLHRHNQKKAFTQVRDCAIRLQKALRSLWSCNCSVVHQAELRLERRNFNEPPCFRVTFPVTSTATHTSLSTWHETEIKTSEPISTTAKSTWCSTSIKTNHTSEHMSSVAARFQNAKISEKKRVAWAITPGVEAASMHFVERNVTSQQGVSQPKAKDIDDLCSFLRGANAEPRKSVLGQFECDDRQYEVASVTRYNITDIINSTLHDLLLEQEQNSTQLGAISWSTGATMPTNSPRLTRKARLELATILASTVLQLHTTPWLESDWSGKDIRICKGSRDHPYISHVFKRSDQGSSIQSSPKPQFTPIRNQAIFRLGVLLLELSLGKPLDSYKTTDRLMPFQDFLLASQLTERLVGEESDSYISATQACIFGNFGCKAKDLDLEDDAFRRAVYEDVVLPLEQDLEFFCRGALTPSPI